DQHLTPYAAMAVRSSPQFRWFRIKCDGLTDSQPAWWLRVFPRIPSSVQDWDGAIPIRRVHAGWSNVSCLTWTQPPTGEGVTVKGTPASGTGFTLAGPKILNPF